MIGVKWRPSSTMYFNAAFSIGAALYALIACFFRHWQHLQAVISVPLLLLLSCYWLVPESPRWLISQGRTDEAEIILQYMASTNGIHLPPTLLKEKLTSQHSTSGLPREDDSSEVDMVHLFKFPAVSGRLIVLSIVWAITAIVYTGMSFGVSDLVSEPRLPFLSTAVAEIPGVFFGWFAMGRYGRKGTILGTMSFNGILSLAVAFIPEGFTVLLILILSLAKLSVSATFTVIYLFAGELFPTVIRGLALGVATTMSQGGLVLAPYILLLGTLYGRNVPFVIFGLLAILATVLLMTLPETLDAPLPTTMQEAENYQEFIERERRKKALSA